MGLEKYIICTDIDFTLESSAVVGKDHVHSRILCNRDTIHSQTIVPGSHKGRYCVEPAADAAALTESFFQSFRS
jgi:hypothetical protein